MSGGGGGSTQTNEPWGPQQPYLQDIMQQGQAIYQGGAGQQYYPGNTVSPFSPQTQMGLDMQTQRAMQGSPVEQSMQDWTMRTMNQPQVGIGGAAQSANQFAGGGDPWSQGLQGASQFGGLGEASQFAGAGAAPPASATGALQQTAAGDYLGSNPYLDASADRITQKFQEQIAPSIAAQFGGAGRARRGSAGVSGGGIQGDVLGNAAGEVAGELARNVYMPAYESERQRQMQAAGGLNQADIQRRGLASQQYLGERGLGQQALVGGGNLGLGGIGAMGDLYGAQQQAQARAGALAPAAAGMDYQNIDRMLQTGAMTEDQAQRLIDAERQRFEFQQQAPWNALGQYSSAVSGMPGGVSTMSGPSQSRMAGIGGGAMAGAGAGSMFGPWGTGIGAIGGGLLGGMS